MPLLYLTHIDRRSEWKAVLSADSFTAGFSEGATLPLPDRTLAAKEVLFTRKDERYQLQDLAQEDRVLLNGTVTREAVLSDADQVQIGRILLRFFEDPPVDAGQVVLRKSESDRSAGPLDLPPPAARPGTLGSEGTTDDSPEPSSEGRLAFLCLLGAVLLCGVLVGLFGLSRGSPRIPATGSETSSSAASSSEEPQTSTAAPSAPNESALSDLRRQLDAMAARSAKAGGSPEPSDAPVPGALIVAVSHADPLGRGGEPEDPWRTRLRAFRLYLDIAGRPPTREEMGRWTSLPPDVQWATVLRQAESPPAWIASVEESFRVLVGRSPYASELAEVTARATEDRPPGFWVAFGDEYSRWERRRPRGDARTAASLVVDLTERAPTRTELSTVQSSLGVPGSRDTVVRVLVHSKRSLLGATPEDSSWWELEFFRFLLRRPTGTERQEIGRWLAQWPQENRLKWLLTSLALYPEYETY